MSKTNKDGIRIAVAGALSVDISPAFVNEPATDFSEVIKPGRITHVEGNVITPGGPVANTGMALPIFGAEPLFIAKVGADGFGSMLIDALAASGGQGSVSGIRADDKVYTAYSVILAPSGLDRAILQNPGANDFFCSDDIDYEQLSKCRHLHFGHPSSMREMYLNDGEQLAEIMERAHDMGLVTSLDLCAVDPDTEAGRQNWKKILKRVLPSTDFFMPSYEELRDILAPGEEPAPAYLALESIALGATNLIIKCGADGMYFRNGDAGIFRSIEKKLGFAEGAMESWEDRAGHAAAKPVPDELVVSGLGAGDTTIAAYLAAMHRGYDFDTTVDLAISEGALCVRHASAVGGLKPFEELI